MNINLLRNKFKSILTIKNKIDDCNNKIQQKIDQLEKIYNIIIEKNKKTNFLIGLDTFHFQKIILKYDQTDLDKYYRLIVNRIYSNYYKLSKIIIKYVHKNIDHKNLEKAITDFNTFEKYDNLDIYKDYGFENIHKLFIEILNIILMMSDYVSDKELELSIYVKNQNSGISINNFVITLENNILTIKNQIKLYINYVDFYLKFHTTYLKRYLNKLRLSLTYINNDIQLEMEEEKIEEEDPTMKLTKKIEDGNETSEEETDEESEEEFENTEIIENNQLIKLDEPIEEDDIIQNNTELVLVNKENKELIENINDDTINIKTVIKKKDNTEIDIIYNVIHDIIEKINSPTNNNNDSNITDNNWSFVKKKKKKKRRRKKK